MISEGANVWHPDMPLEYRNQIVTGDARELAKQIPDKSVDLIFTDPVYSEKDIYIWLAETAQRILKNGGALLCWSNGGWHKKNTEWLETNLVYRWTFAHLWRPGPGKLQGKIIAKANRVLWFDKKGDSVLIDYLADGHITVPWSKAHSHNHKWTKDPGYIKRALMAFHSSVVLDPLCGGGTIPAVCKLEDRNYVAFEIDPEIAELARKRVRTTQSPLFVPQPEQLELK